MSIWATREVIRSEGGREEGVGGSGTKRERYSNSCPHVRGILCSFCICVTVSLGLLHRWLLFPRSVSGPARPGRHGRELRPLLRTGDVGPAGGRQMSHGGPFCASGSPGPPMLRQFLSEHCALPGSPELSRFRGVGGIGRSSHGLPHFEEAYSLDDALWLPSVAPLDLSDTWL